MPASPSAPPSAPVGEAALQGALARLGHSAFRPGQREIIEAVLRGSDTVAVMPTGGGKSLCYQLPAMLLQGVTLVVSPLIALMRDQVAALQARGLPVTFINSALSTGEREERQAQLGRYRLVYVAPERFRSPRFLDAISRVPLSLLAVDEAHCISEWGHDFRPDYRRLGDVMRQLRPERRLALTATATPEVRGDIVAQLQLSEPQVFVHGFDRPNLALAVERAGGDRDKLGRAARLLASTPSGTAIVYTATRKKAEAVAEGLGAAGFIARPYHAGLPDEERHRTERLFLGGDLPIIVATNAFGMGIDKRDVRLVLHHDLPRAPEAYYQEAGRAGRDGQPARCVMLFNAGDARVQEFLIEQSAPDPGTFRLVYERVQDLGPIADEVIRGSIPSLSGATVDAALRALLQAGAISDEEGGYRVSGPLRWDAEALARRQERERQKLRRMVSYGYHVGCRMRFFLDYFGDHFDEDSGPAARCGRCDNCQQASAPLSDAEHLIVRKALSAVARMDGRFGRRRVAEVLHGSATQEVERAGLQHLSTFGILSERPLAWLMDLLTTLEGAGLLGSSGGEYPTVRLLQAGREVMLDRARATLRLPEERTAEPARRKPRIHAPVRSTGAQRLLRPAPEDAPPSAKPTPPGAGRGARADATDDDLPLTAAQEERFTRLRQMRGAIAKKEQIAPFIVFHDRTLRAIARAAPADAEALRRVSGVGDAKIAKYGDAVLEALEGRDAT